ncbi:hypothetical protein Q4610_10825 [Sphingobium sp. HBC34]|uniref:DUF4185 domain-containing protein n=1 Tax=Sphingobium cyanobacteriorum TaxID=3063954 RepID=A0ABT8ZLY2_9SPHN|nr:hypothetical protein [Sphingobium sp. HBC34]MDO7835535.1 hypothetical protein [Sphingobium sp. HBC34]
MTSRRDMLKQGLLLGVAATCAPFAAQAARSRSSAVIGVERKDDTILRLGGLGDGYKMTWTADGRQLVAVNDGIGWADPPKAFYNSRLWSITGPVERPLFQDVPGYPDLNMSTRPEDAPHYHGHGLIAVRGRLVQFLSTLDRAEDRPRHWTGAKLIYSDDQGKSWHNQDGSSPVRFEDWTEQSRESLTFFQEPDGCFSLLALLQMGRDYSANRDGYIYGYGLNGNVDGLMNQLVMFRVPIAKIRDRSAYRFFGGHRGHGGALWVRDIEARAVVHEFPRGWVNGVNLFPGDLVVESWLPSIVYNDALGLYMMASAGIGCAPDGTEFGKPSYLGVWVSDQPWGPWRQVHEDKAWTPGGDMDARAYAPQIAPGWISRDGRSVWIVWADLNGIRAFGQDEALLGKALESASGPEAHSAIEAAFLRRYMPRFAMNAQRIDLTVTQA